MSRHTARRRAQIDALADELAIGAAIRLRTDSDRIRPIVDAVVAYLLEEYPGQDLYIPACRVELPVAEIQAELRAGKSMKEVCARFRISRATVYRVLDAAA